MLPVFCKKNEYWKNKQTDKQTNKHDAFIRCFYSSDKFGSLVFFVCFFFTGVALNMCSNKVDNFNSYVKCISYIIIIEKALSFLYVNIHQKQYQVSNNDFTAVWQVVWQVNSNMGAGVRPEFQSL